MRYENLARFGMLGKDGQERVRQARVAIVGVGALGSVAAEMLVRMGVGQIVLIDRDVVELSNLQRQGLYEQDDVYKLKAIVAKEKLLRMNGEVEIRAHAVDLDVENVQLLAGVDVILDGTDNFYTRFVLNDFCKQKKIPWVFAGVVGSKGMVLAIRPEGPCLRCVFQEPQGMLETCDTEGVLASAVHAVAALQVTEALKIVTKQGSVALVALNVWDRTFDALEVVPRGGCPACAGNFEFLEGMKKENVVKVCGANAFQFKREGIDLQEVAQRWEKLGKIVRTEHCVFFQDLIVFQDGRVLVKASSLENAKGVYASYLG